MLEKAGGIMSQYEKQLFTILSGTRDSNIRFADLCKVLDGLGFQCRIKGDHHIYYREDIRDILNIQPQGNKAKAYQVKQVRDMILKYKLGGNFYA